MVEGSGGGGPSRAEIGIQRVKIVKIAIFTLFELSEASSPLFNSRKPSEDVSEVGQGDSGSFHPFSARLLCGRVCWRWAEVGIQSARVVFQPSDDVAGVGHHLPVFDVIRGCETTE